MPFVFEDSVGSDDLLIPNSSLWTPGSPVLPNGDPGYKASSSGHAWVSDPTNKWVVNASPQIHTWEIWTRLQDVGAGDNVTSFILGHGPSPWSDATFNWRLLYVSNVGLYNEHLDFQIRRTGTVDNWTAGLDAYTNNWYHIVIQVKFYSSSGYFNPQVRIYLNGSLVAGYSGNNITNGVSNSSSSRLWLGNALNSGGSHVFTPWASNGVNNASKLAFYSRELTLAEIEDHYRAMTYV